MARTDGGPAFPKTDLSQILSRATLEDTAEFPSEGMSLRDYFAGQILTSAASIAYPLRDEDEHGNKIDREQIMADWCYLVADAMLKAREKA